MCMVIILVGQFGIVYKAHLVKHCGLINHRTETVAVKILKGMNLCPVVAIVLVTSCNNYSYIQISNGLTDSENS